MQEIVVDNGRRVIHWNGPGIYIAQPRQQPHHFYKISDTVKPGPFKLTVQYSEKPKESTGFLSRR